MKRKVVRERWESFVKRKTSDRRRVRPEVFFTSRNFYKPNFYKSTILQVEINSLNARELNPRRQVLAQLE